MVVRGSVAKLRQAVRLLFSGIEEEGGLVAAAPVMQVREIFLRFWPYAHPYRRWLPLILLFAVLGSALEAATIWMYKILVDEVLLPRDFALLVWVVLAYLGLTLAEGVVSFCEEYLSEWVARLSDDIEEIEELMVSETASALTYLFQFVFFVGALFYLQWRLALVSLFVIPLFLLVARYFSQKIRGATREERRRSGSISAVAEESLSNAALVQAYNRQENEVSRFRRENEGSFVAEMAATRLSALFSPLVNLIELAGVVVVIAVGTWELSQGRLTIGGLLVFLIYLRQLYTPVQGLSNLLNTLYEATAGAERVIEVFDQKPSVTEPEGAFALNLPRGHVEFDSVRFSYPGNEREALSDVSFEVGPGEVLALVGPSGSGKSTVAKLLLRFYDPNDGAVRLDGRDLRELALADLREQVALLLQETLVFDGSVAENIGYGRPDSTFADVE